MITALIGPVMGILEKVIPDTAAREKMAHELASMAEKHIHEAAMAQAKINEAEAAHRSIFVAGWRPFIGWVCGISMAWHFLLVPSISFFLPERALPTFDMDSLMTVLFGMLGLGGLRTIEKYKGLTK